MRDTVETFDGIEKLKLATVAAALLIPPVLMMVAAPQPRMASVKTSELTPTRVQQQSTQQLPVQPQAAPQQSARQPALGALPARVRPQFKLVPSSHPKLVPTRDIKAVHVAQLKGLEPQTSPVS